MANASFTTKPPGGPAPTTFHSGPRPQPAGCVPAVCGAPAPTVMKSGTTQPKPTGHKSGDAPGNVQF